MFSALCGPDTELGKVFLEYSSRGKLVPDEPTIELWRKTISGSTQMGRFHPEIDTLVLDGIPRNVRQAENFERYTECRRRLLSHFLKDGKTWWPDCNDARSKITGWTMRTWTSSGNA